MSAGAHLGSAALPWIYDGADKSLALQRKQTMELKKYVYSTYSPLKAQ
jgi:hypothetical protein